MAPILMLLFMYFNTDLQYEFERLYLREQVQIPITVQRLIPEEPVVTPVLPVTPKVPVTSYNSPVGHFNISGWAFSAQHPGVDLWCVEGAPVRAMAAGTITFAGWSDDGFGYSVWIDHGGGLLSHYAHLEPPLANGRVSKNSYLGLCGASGWSGGQHLHWEVWLNGEPIDPLTQPTSLIYNGPIRYSHYWPPLGGTNCSNFINGQCLSRTASGERWQEWIDRGAACPPTFPFGAIINLNGEEWVCIDRGGKVNTRNGIPTIDFLERRPQAGYGTLLQVQIYQRLQCVAFNRPVRYN